MFVDGGPDGLAELVEAGCSNGQGTEELIPVLLSRSPVGRMS